ncbi:hypothetical protein [Vibrio parahaemolyticus]|uniref:hypothetical protein n=1 Tax=Vibrio parahaemolyticus TaxID=670 RepID=UPI00214BA890|nr:hypothetical protein [Vibrio parahaemolyticus]
MSQLITSKAERYQRNYEKMATVIQFLKQEVYSDITNLMLLLRYKKRQTSGSIIIKVNSARIYPQT